MGAYLNRMKRMMERNHPGELFPIREYWDDKEVFVCDGPAIGSFIICQPTNGGNDKLKSALTHLYRLSVPEGTALQVQLVSLPDIEYSLSGYRSLRGKRTTGEDEERLDAIAAAQHDFVQRSTIEPVNDRGFIFRNYELWVTLKTPTKDVMPSNKEIHRHQELVKEIISSMDIFSPVQANEILWYRRMCVIFNMYDGDWFGTPPGKHRTPMDTDLRNCIIDPGKRLDVQKDGISIEGDKGNETQYIKTLTVSKIPDILQYGFMMGMVYDFAEGRHFIDQHFMLSLNIIYPEQHQAIKSLRKKRNFVTSQAKGDVLKYLDKLRYQKEDLDAVMQEIEQDGSMLIRYSMQYTIFGRDKKAADKAAKTIIGINKTNNIKITEDSHFTVPSLVANCPFGLHEVYSRHSGKFGKATTNILPYLTPHMASWKGNTNAPVFQLVSRAGQVINLDFFKSPTNKNVAVAASSGAGKSFFVANVVNSYLNSGVKKQRNPDDPRAFKRMNDASQVFIMDVGYSYVGIAEQYADSQYLEFSEQFKYSLNPFPSVDKMKGVDGQAGMIASIIKTMAFPQGGITNFQDTELLGILNDVYEQLGRNATITDVQKACLAHEADEIQTIGRQLRPFSQGGVYEELFSNKKPPVNFDSRLVVIELEHLKGNKHLQITAIMATIMAIQRKMFLSGPNIRSLFVLEEAWEFIQASNDGGMMKYFTDFIAAGWRRFRKVNGSGICVTQGVADYYETELGRTIKENSAWQILLRQEEEAVDALKESGQYSGSPGDFKLLKSMRKVSPSDVSNEAFSEMMIKSPEGSDICRLYADRRQQLILTTDADEKAIRAQYMKRGMSLLEAVDAMLDEERQTYAV